MRLLLILTFISSQAFAQTEEAGVKQIINNMFEGMKRGDTALIRSCFTTAPLLQTLRKDKEDRDIIDTEPLDSFLAIMARPHKDVYDERITFNVVWIDGNLAMAWTPYRFYIGEKFSHCGVDSFQLVKINGTWRIQYLIDTRRKQNCD
jgi:hypothetical protein